MTLADFIAACAAVSATLNGFDQATLASLQANEAVTPLQFFALAKSANLSQTQLSFL